MLQRLQQCLAYGVVRRRNRAALPAPSCARRDSGPCAPRSAARGALARRRCVPAARPGNPAARPDRSARRWPPRTSARGARRRHPHFRPSRSAARCAPAVAACPARRPADGAKFTPATAIFDRSSSLSRGIAVTFTASSAPPIRRADPRENHRRHLNAHAKPNQHKRRRAPRRTHRHPPAHPAERQPLLAQRRRRQIVQLLGKFAAALRQQRSRRIDLIRGLRSRRQRRLEGLLFVQLLAHTCCRPPGAR